MLALVVGAVALAGCEVVSEVWQPEPAPTVTRLEVFNRTEEEIFLVDATGGRLDVSACDRAVAEAFVLDSVEVSTAGGSYGYAFGAPAPDPAAPAPQWLVIASGMAGVPEPNPPAELPECRGRLSAQPGG